MYWIDDYAFYETKLEGELTLPDGLGPIGMAAFSGTSLTKVTFPKVYGNNAEYPARLWTNNFGSTLKEVVFLSYFIIMVMEMALNLVKI